MISITQIPSNHQTLEALHEFVAGLRGGNEIDIAILKDYPIDSLGYKLYEHYQENPSIPHPNNLNGFPARYILIHDLHHLLIQSGVDDQGEAEVMAFECGLLSQVKSELCLLPFISQLLESFRHTPNLDFIKIAQCFDVGLKAEGNLFETWEFESDLILPLKDAQEKYKVTRA